MKFNRILEQYVKESEALTKIMLKVDPANSINKDYRDFDGYEGYILKENNNKWSVLFENIDMPVMDVPFSVIKVVDIPCDETFNNVRMFGLKAIEERKGLTMEIINKIQACNSIDFLEQYLKEEGLNDSEIKDVYKKALLGNLLGEGVIDKLKTAGKWAVRGLGTVLAPDYAIAGAIKTGVEKIKNIMGHGKTNKEEDTTKATSKATSKVTHKQPPIPVKNAVDGANAIGIPNTGGSSETKFLLYVQTNLLPTNNYVYYKNDIEASHYYVNNKTRDIIKIKPDITNGSRVLAQFGNLNSAVIDIAKVQKYLKSTFVNEQRTNKVFFINTSFSTLP